MIELIAHALGRGRFRVELDGRTILASSRQPLLDGARVVLAEGAAPETRIGMRHMGSDHIALSSTVGAAAKLMVREDDRGGPSFVPWKASPFADVSSPMRFSGLPVP